MLPFESVNRPLYVGVENLTIRFVPSLVADSLFVQFCRVPKFNLRLAVLKVALSFSLFRLIFLARLKLVC